MSLDERIQHAEAAAKAAQKRVKRLELEKRKRLLLALGRYVIKETKAASVAEFQDNFVIVARSQEAIHAGKDAKSQQKLAA
jgi:acyl-CoA reductase-like NAD-dependent aldehyde dehydrogenase